jgi:two-component system chemotaxis response regulator CheY
MAEPGHILLVDDDADFRGAVALLLVAHGHTVVEAADGQLGLNALASPAPFNLVILDLMMPVMDGAIFLEQKARGPHAELPVVIFSSSTPSIGLVGFAGVVAFVAKLEGPGGLLPAIRHARDALLPQL